MPDREKLFATNSSQEQARTANPLHAVIQSFRSKKLVMILNRLLFVFKYFPINCHQPALQTEVIINTVNAVKARD